MDESGGLENRCVFMAPWVRILPPPPEWYILGTSFTFHSWHIVYTYLAYLAYFSKKEVRYAVEGEKCYG